MNRKVVIFGGTGFLGRRVVRHLLDHAYAVRVASRHPERGKSIFSTDRPQLELVRADIGEDAAIRDAVTDAFAAVNAVSLYVERENQTFHSVHVEAAERLARHSREAGIARLVHVSGIGADPASHSPYSLQPNENDGCHRDKLHRRRRHQPAWKFCMCCFVLIEPANRLGRERFHPWRFTDVGGLLDHYTRQTGLPTNE